MSIRELNAAGITDPMVRMSYLRCKELNKQYGKTYYLATLLLPPSKRPFVHALYGLARYADEIVDDMESGKTDEERAIWLSDWSASFFADLDRGVSDDPICRAVVDTAVRWEIPREYFEAFFTSMTMDLTVTEYETFDDLFTYVYGSAAVIGLQVVPILEPSEQSAFKYAQDLGIAFQLANFIREVGEDLDRGRIYLPMSELKAHGVTHEMLHERILTPQIKSALQEQIARVRRLQAEAAPGIKLLSPESQACIEAASELYCGIVDEVEKIDFQIFEKRAKTSTWRRIKVAAPALLRARRAR